ncbi:MAG: type II toxin-antitoxin system RelE/ParE family toxin [Candidatus Acidiferrales bacterium]
MPEIRPVAWIGSSKADLSAFPEEVKDSIGFALYVAQQGGKHRDAKPLRGFDGAGILEMVDDFDGDAYRAVYTVRFAGRVYVLHVFQKKSKTGIKTPKAEINLIQSRLKRAEEEHNAWLERQKGTTRHGQDNRRGRRQRKRVRGHRASKSRGTPCEG